jgi:hypothetical protein
MVKRKFEFGLSNGFCTMGGAISGEKKELSCQVTRNMGKLPHYRDKCHILRQCHKIIVTHNNNMDNNKIVCPHCGKNNFKCSRGLTQHLRNAAYCSQAEKEKKDKEDGYFTAPETITFGDNYWQMHHNKLAKRAANFAACSEHKIWPGNELLSIRDAVLTVSPNSPYRG